MKRRMATCGGLTGGIIAHILHVCSAGFAYGLQSVGKRFDACRIYAATAYRLSVGSHSREHKIGIRLAVIPRLVIGSLATDHRDVIIETGMSDAVVLRQKDALCSQSLGQVRSEP